MPARRRHLLAAIVAVGALAACSQAAPAEAPDVVVSGAPKPTPPPSTIEPAPQKPTPPPTTTAAAKNTTVRIAFGGDVHFAGSSAAALTGDVGTAFGPLKAADLAVVNLETAITTGGTPAPKEFTFRAPASALSVLRRAGIDVVTIANNHGMDYGRTGLADTLAAGRRTRMPIIGAGKDVTAAFTPYRTTIRGLRVAVLGATDVLDDAVASSWTATDTTAGLASAKDPELLPAAVRAAAGSADVVVVVLHWGQELRSCPTARQESLARRLTAAGADVVVGSHAHVLEPSVRTGRTAIHYGLGNFVFYATRAANTQSGVYTVTVSRRGVEGTSWDPAKIVGGRPQLLTGAAADAADQRAKALASSCGV